MSGTKDYAVLDLQDESESLGVDLQFQGIRTTAFDFGETRTQTASHEQTITFDDFPDTPDDELEQEKLLGEEDEDQPIGLKKGTGFWTFEFYQQFFDVESKQVGDRILWSMVPKPGVSYLQSYIRPNPDLYGPFWICMTLTFTTGITGNLANYLGTDVKESYDWKYDFHKVTLAATAIFSYAWLIPLAMWGLLVWRGSRAKISLLELLCIYGYSLAIFIPVSILWIVPQAWFKWCLAIVAPVLSGSVLVRTIWPSLSQDAKKVAIGIAVFILVLHATLALGFMLYFFAAPDKTPSPVMPVAPVNAADAKTQTPLPTKRETEKEKNEKKEVANEVADALNLKEPGGDGAGGENQGQEVPAQEQGEVGEKEKKSIAPGRKPVSVAPDPKPESVSPDVKPQDNPKVEESKEVPQSSKSEAKDNPSTVSKDKTGESVIKEENNPSTVSKAKTGESVVKEENAASSTQSKT